jgi:hypothetical protein
MIDEEAIIHNSHSFELVFGCLSNTLDATTKQVISRLWKDWCFKYSTPESIIKTMVWISYIDLMLKLMVCADTDTTMFHIDFKDTTLSEAITIVREYIVLYKLSKD